MDNKLRQISYFSRVQDLMVKKNAAVVGYIALSAEADGDKDKMAIFLIPDSSVIGSFDEKGARDSWNFIQQEVVNCINSSDTVEERESVRYGSKG